ncbi:MAG: hypothetical protein LBM92_02275 [Opitutaceae bacterium]|jgi:hypothetical protein|nr:hypothetical protein [Opitutaceae bacterium]
MAKKAKKKTVISGEKRKKSHVRGARRGAGSGAESGEGSGAGSGEGSGKWQEIPLPCHRLAEAGRRTMDAGRRTMDDGRWNVFLTDVMRPAPERRGAQPAKLGVFQESGLLISVKLQLYMLSK